MSTGDGELVEASDERWRAVHGCSTGSCPRGTGVLVHVDDDRVLLLDIAGPDRADA